MVIQNDFLGKMCDGCTECKPKTIINQAHNTVYVSCEHCELCYRLIEYIAKRVNEAKI